MRGIWAAIVVAGLAGLSTAAPVAQAARSVSTRVAACGPTWVVVPSPSFDEQFNLLLSAAAISDQDVWAVGWHEASFTQPMQTLTEHWNGTQWTTISSPNIGTSSNSLAAVAAISATDVWAVGQYSTDTGPVDTLTLHWDGVQWNVVPSPNRSTQVNSLTAVAAVATDDVWAAGYEYDGPTQKAITEHWNGTHWQLVKSPSPSLAENFVSGLAAVASGDVWGVGVSDLVTPFVEHWDGVKWQQVKAPNRGKRVWLWAVTTINTADVWAVGYYGAQTGAKTAAEHWDGTRWRLSSTPNVGNHDNSFHGTAHVSSIDVWAVGDAVNGAFFDRRLIAHWNGLSWQVAASPNVGSQSNDLLAVAALSDGKAWAVGTFVDEATGHRNTLVEQICE